MNTEDKILINRQVYKNLSNIRGSIAVENYSLIVGYILLCMKFNNKKNYKSTNDLLFYRLSDYISDDNIYQLEMNIKPLLVNIKDIDNLICELKNITNSADFNYALFFDEVLKNIVRMSRFTEYYQPKEVSLLVDSLLPNNAKLVYNPFAGVASYQIANISRRVYGQELNQTTWLIGKIRLLLNDISNNDYSNENSLLNWLGNSMQYDAIVATPPFQLLLNNKYPMLEESNLRFKHKTVEGLFFERAINSMNDNCTVIGLVSIKFLYNSATSSTNFKKYLVKEGLIKKIILLPSNIFYNTSIPSAIIVLSQHYSERILMVDASSCVITDKRKNIVDYKHILSKIEKGDNNIVKYVGLETIYKNNLNLLPSIYFIKEEIIPEGYLTLKLRDISTVIRGKKIEGGNTRGYVVNIRDLSTDNLYYDKSIDELEIQDIKHNYRKITSSVLLLSKIRFLKPTYIKATEETPIYIGFSILAIEISNENVFIPYLAYELLKKEERLQNGLVITIFSPNEILDLPLTLPTIKSQQVAIIEKIRSAKKEALIKEMGLTDIIEQQKKDFIDELKIKKHNLAQYLTEINCGVSALLKYSTLKGYGTELISNRHNISLSEHISKLLVTVDEMSKTLELLTQESKFGNPAPIDIAKVLNGIKGTSLYSVNYSVDKESIEASEILVNISQNDFHEVIKQIISNAEKHGFTKETNNNLIDIYVSYEIKTDLYVIEISNNGNPMPKGLDTHRYGIKGEIAGANGNEGIGGFRVKSIIEHFGGSYEVVIDDLSIFQVKIKIKLPRLN